MRTFIALACALILACSPFAVWAQEAPRECQPGQACEPADPNAMGDTLQDPSVGPSVETPTAQPEAPQPETPAPPVVPVPPSTCGAPTNPWNFSFCGTQVIRTPPATFCSVFACIATFWRQTNGYVMQCRDGLFSHSGGVSGSCSSHGGNSRPLYAT